MAKWPPSVSTGTKPRCCDRSACCRGECERNTLGDFVRKDKLMDNAPHVSRSITLHFYGDWGQANLHRVCGWLVQEVGDRSGPHSRFAIWNGRGGTDAVRAVGRGQVDV